jgi:hypothetical protein
MEAARQAWSDFFAMLFLMSVVELQQSVSGPDRY